MRRLWIISGLLISSTLEAGKNKGNLQQCSDIKSKIESIEDKRRDGGTAAQMNLWKKQEYRHNDKFSGLDCKRYRKKFRR